MFTLNEIWRTKLVDRFLKYVKIHSTSDASSETTPSTAVQWDMANLLFEEMKAIGLEDVSIDEYGYVFGFIPATRTEDVPQVGFIAHYDTTADFNGIGINPQIWENYDGGELLLNPETGFSLSPEKFGALSLYKGQTLITTDGTTLLSADDKAGVAEIMTAAEYLIAHPEIPHGRISIGFNPDEEIGRGAHKFDVEKFGAEWAYTMDGGQIGELEYENFNASGAKITIQGLSVHPGYSYGKMRNAGLIAAEFVAGMPQNETPATTQGFEGFYHLIEMSAEVSTAQLSYIIRDHDANKFAQREDYLSQRVEYFNEKYGEGTLQIEFQPQYRNMKEQFDGKMHIIDLAAQAMREAGIEPDIKAIRGGTDGAQLSFMGLPCPNIFAGGHYFHGPYEFVPVESMLKATEVILRIASNVK